MNYLTVFDSESNISDFNKIPIPESFHCVDVVYHNKDSLDEHFQSDEDLYHSDLGLIIAHISNPDNTQFLYDCIIHNYLPDFVILMIGSATNSISVSSDIQSIRSQLRRNIGACYHIEVQSFQLTTPSTQMYLVIATGRSLVDTCPLMFYPNNINTIDSSSIGINSKLTLSNVVSLILHSIEQHKSRKPLLTKTLQKIIIKNNLNNPDKLLSFIEHSDLYITDLYKICDLANNQRTTHAAYHTSMHIAYSTIEYLPDEISYEQSISILEPSVGSGIFVYLLAKKYPNKKLYFDCVDIDIDVLNMMYRLMNKHDLSNIYIKKIHSDFLLCNTLQSNYDLVVGNPPFMKVMYETLKSYQARYTKSISTNIFTFFLEKILQLSKWVALITPKALLNVAEYIPTRELMNAHKVIHINDFNEKAFNVKIETISFILEIKTIDSIDQEKISSDIHKTLVYSYLTKDLFYEDQKYITNNQFNTWLLYRNDRFDNICKKMIFGVFKVFRDRVLTKKNTKLSGQYQVIKARNIGNNSIINVPGYNRYIDKEDLNKLAVAKFINQQVIIIPNLTTNIRAARLPKNAIADGSAAILYSENGFVPSDADIEFFSSQEFNEFYKIARNYGTRSLNIDKVSVKYFGILCHDLQFR